MLAGFHRAAQAQDKKVWASGAARSVFQQNNLSVDGDTITPKRLNRGHTLVDLAKAEVGLKTLVAEVTIDYTLL